MRCKLSFLAIVAAAMIPSANAAVCISTTNCTFAFNSTNVVGFGTGPFGTVDLALNGSSIVFTVDLTDGFGFNLIDSGTHEAFTFNNTLGGAVTMSGFSSALYSQNWGAAPYDNPPFSDFDHAVKSTCGNGGGCGVNKLIFTVDRVGGFTDVNQLVDWSTGSGTAAFFAADIANGAGVTGVVGVTGPPSQVPEPAYSFLLGAGLIGIGVMAAAAVQSQEISPYPART